MNNRELQKIIEEIQKGEAIKITAIAAKAKVNRSYLSSLINDKEIQEVEIPFLGKIKKAYPGYFGDQQKTTDDSKIDQILANLNDIREYAIALITGQTAGQEVMMGALDRLEKNPEGSLSEAADKLALRLAERMNVIQTGKKDGARK